MAGTLIIDHDGIYDPSLLNDRLLLGLKGTMNDFEISLLRQRALEAHKRKVRRGLVLTQVPIGYVRTEDYGMEKTPDRQIQEAIAGIFRKFRALGSVRQVLLWYRDEKIPIPAYSREPGKQKMVWNHPVYARIFSILKNPPTPASSSGAESIHAPRSSTAAHAKQPAITGRRSSGRSQFQTTMRGILLGTSSCETRNRSARTPDGTPASALRRVQPEVVPRYWRACFVVAAADVVSVSLTR